MLNLYSVKSVRKEEELKMQNGTLETALMERAGFGVFSKLQKNLSYLIICGGGNNGGDGFAIAYFLKKEKTKVSVISIKEPKSQASKHFFNLCKTEQVEFLDLETAKTKRFDAIIDCIFGIGLNCEISKPYLEYINFINEKRKESLIISCDVPSGLCADSGLYGGAVAHKTYTIGLRKIGLFINKAKDFAGDIELIDIGLEEVEPCAKLLEEKDFSDILTKRANFSHKNSYGTVGIFGGSVDYSGAPKLSNLSLSAILSGAGIARLIVPYEIQNFVLPYILESTLKTVPSSSGRIIYDEKAIDLALEGLKALAFGMGLTNCEDTQKTLEYILKTKSLNLLIDADGINSLANCVNLLKETRCNVILTPHVKEFSRISGFSVDEIIKNPIERTTAFAKEFGVVVLLKGTSTIITDGAQVFVVNKGTAGLATGGSGDMLSGIIVGLLGYNDVSPKVGALGSFILGLASEIMAKDVCEIAHAPSNLVHYIPKAITEIFNKSNGEL